MVQYSNRAKTRHQSENDGTILKQSQSLSPVRKRWYNTQKCQNLSTVRKRTSTILKQSQKLSPVRKRWYNTQAEPKPVNSQKKMVNSQTVPKPANSQKKMVQYSKVPKPVSSQKKVIQHSNKAKNCHQSEKDGTILN